MADDIEITSDFPVFESIDTLHKRSVTPPTPVSAESVVIDTELDSIPMEQPAPRRRGRPKGSKNRPKDGSGVPLEGVETKLSGRLAKDVSLRGQQVLKGASKVGALWRPHIEMRDDEAQNIADPLASYATRKAEESSAVGEFLRESLDNFDLVAAVIGVTSYVIRVVKDENEYRQFRAESDQRYRSDGASRERVDTSRRTVQVDRPIEFRQETPDTVYGPQSSSDNNQVVPAVSTPSIGQL